MTSENRFDSESAKLIIESKIPDDALIEFSTLKWKLGEKTFTCPRIRKMTFLKKKSIDSRGQANVHRLEK
uniref:Transposase n=1 Tax=Strongyloides papillosus TaxID=174720 RepID=A0A0N5BVD7_STREA